MDLIICECRTPLGRAHLNLDGLPQTSESLIKAYELVFLRKLEIAVVGFGG